MNILIVGSGGREHAIAWKLAQSDKIANLFFAPGNAGTAELGENLPVASDDIANIIQIALEKAINLVVIGPEVPLALGLTDSLVIAGLKVFGPTRAAARIESSKAFAREFMTRHEIPSPRYAIFSNFEKAQNYLEQVDYPIVIKASGLAAGKGVFLPETLAEGCEILRNMLAGDAFGDAGKIVLIEERLEGEEISLMAFTDGQTVYPMPPAQDHKRLLDGDQGPNTGGMGAYAPAPACPPGLTADITRTILQPAVDGLRSEGMPFVGVLYAGLMLTQNGPQVLEFNCRFGDPETQAILPLLDSDLFEVMAACVNGDLSQKTIRWKAGYSACVVLASEKYPLSGSSGQPIKGLDRLPLGSLHHDSVIFHAGTRYRGNEVVTNGGRVLGVQAWGSDLQQTLGRVYSTIQQISFPGMQYRCDIGYRALKSRPRPDSAYSQSGVDIDAGNRAVELMTDAVRSTYTSAVLAGIGSFGGLFDASALMAMRKPVLVSSTDGVGTKVKLAAQTGSYRSIGFDLVNHCVNDILVQGARPLFFLDYFASSKLIPELVAEVITGVADACREANCVLIGGETAEMPGVYAEKEFDLAGTIVGVVEKDDILPHHDIQPGDTLIGLASSGPHTNGFSLLRQLLDGIPLTLKIPGSSIMLGEALLAPHRSYLHLLSPILTNKPCFIKGLAHLTGGGFIENVPRILPQSCGALIHWGSWPIPPLFQFVQERGQIDWVEMARVFNLGIGMVIIVSPSDVKAIQQMIAETSWVIGEVTSGERKVRMV